MCVSGLLGRNASGRGRTWHVHARRMNMAGCWTWVLEAHGEQGVQMKAHGPRSAVQSSELGSRRSSWHLVDKSWEVAILALICRGSRHHSEVAGTNRT